MKFFHFFPSAHALAQMKQGYSERFKRKKNKINKIKQYM